MRDHPRMRGEYRFGNSNQYCYKGSPPHARGILIETEEQTGRTGITPACAGNTSLSGTLDIPCRDHPRMRGEYLAVMFGIVYSQGSPPHARGILTYLHYTLCFVGITPACAGNTVVMPVL